jgi:hypothetical protein
MSIASNTTHRKIRYRGRIDYLKISSCCVYRPTSQEAYLATIFFQSDRLLGVSNQKPPYRRATPIVLLYLSGGWVCFAAQDTICPLGANQGQTISDPAGAFCNRKPYRVSADQGLFQVRRRTCCTDPQFFCRLLLQKA